MLFIKEIHIKNFRSIVNMVIQTKNLNIFVGLNDVGKSNVLKALNLFFNNQTDENSNFNFELDYSKLAPQRKNKPREVMIQIKFDIPSHYIDSGEFTWKKVWRGNRIHSDSLPGHKFSAYSKTPVLLNRINYTYVPATKSSEYFMRLLGQLYTCISADAGNEISRKTDEYAEVIQTFTKRIGEIIKNNVGIESALTMPPNQYDIFKLLTFNTKDSMDNNVFLEQRGDGIKSRHIPAILKFISEFNGDIYDKRGTVPTTTLWGYEEPETGIELSMCFTLAEELLRYSKSIQIFTTTHSPAFYSLEDLELSKTFLIAKNKSTGESISVKDKNNADIHTEIGLMPLITTYVKEKEQEILKLKAILKENFLTDVNTVCVEGKTDKEALEYIIKNKSEKLRKMMELGTFRVLTSTYSGGTQRLVDWIKSWKYSGFESKLYLLFDKDEAGISAKDEAVKLSGELKLKNTKCQFYQPSNEIKYILSMMKNKGSFYYELEHLYSVEYWKLLKDAGKLELRPDKEMQKMFAFELNCNDSVNAFIDRVYDNKDIRDTIITYNPGEKEKNAFFPNAKREYEKDNNSNIFDGFQNTLIDIEKFF